MQVEDPRTPIQNPNSGRITWKLGGIVFCLHLLVISLLAVVLTIRGLLYHGRPRFQPLDWYPPVFTSVGLAGIVGLAWQTINHHHPSRAIKLAFWFSPLLVCAMGILLISIGSAGGLAFGVLSILVGIVQSLYACWASPRFSHAVSVLTVSTAFPPPKTTILTILTVIITVVYCCVLMGGAGGATATGTHIDKLLIAVILLSMIWTMHTIKNILQVSIARVKYLHFSCGDELNTCAAFRDTIRHLVGPILVGSVLIPVVGLVRGSARAVTLVAGDSDEFLFSCADCYSGIASRLVTCGNRWGFVHVGVYGKGVIRASGDTWEMFRRSGMEQLIDRDLTSSFCFFCGLAGGALSSLAGGSWALVVHKGYATEISVYGFLIGYLMSRIAIAWPQACVLAYHVAFAENPQSARFDATIPVRLQEHFFKFDSCLLQCSFPPFGHSLHRIRCQIMLLEFRVLICCFSRFPSPLKTIQILLLCKDIRTTSMSNHIITVCKGHLNFVHLA